MKYITGIHALNLPCSLDTCGDWHTSALKWENICFNESENSVWGNFGIETNKIIPEHTGTYNVANHIRALLDLIKDGNFAIAQGMRDDFICNDRYTELIFEKVSMLRSSSNWDSIDSFMGREYCRAWLIYKEKNYEQ